MKDLDTYLHEMTLRHLRREFSVTPPGGHHDVDDDMPDTRGYDYILLEDVADPNSRIPFEAIEFDDTSEEMIEESVEGIEFLDLSWMRRNADDDIVEFNGAPVPLDRIEVVLEAVEEELEESCYYDCCASCDADYEEFLEEMEPGAEFIDVDFGPTRASGRKLLMMNPNWTLPHFKDINVIERLTRAKSSSLKQNHRRRPVVDLPMPASVIDN